MNFVNQPRSSNSVKGYLLLLSAFWLSLSACGADLRQSIDEWSSSNQDSKWSSTRGPIHSPHGWQNVVTLYVQASAPSALKKATEKAVQIWNDAVGFDILVYQGSYSINGPKDLFSSLDDEISVVYYETHWSDVTSKSSGVLATTIWENDVDDPEAIVKGDIIFNGEHFVPFYYDINASEQEPIIQEANKDIVEAVTIMVHEVGHLLGLDHIDPQEDSQKSIMAPQASVEPGTYFSGLSTQDIQHIRSIYHQ